MLRGLLLKALQRRLRVSRLTLRAEDFSAPDAQLPLFQPVQDTRSLLSRQRRLALALDAIRARFGEEAVGLGKTARCPSILSH
jgi:hypothetical protein